MTEAAFKSGEWGDDKDEIRGRLAEIWDDHVAQEAARLANAWSPAVPPTAEEWPGYQLTRSRTIRRAERLVASKVMRAERPLAGTGIEVVLEDPVSNLFGRVDRIERDGSSVRVVDLKTGLQQGEPSEAQTRQLLLYAVLVHRTTGEWPREVAIEDASGQQVAIPLEPAAAEDALQQTLSAVTEFNDRIKVGNLSDAVEPGPEKCRWCVFRVVCHPYWEELRADWEHRSVLGEIISVGVADSGSHADVRVLSPSDAPVPVVRVTALAGAVAADGERWVAAIDLRWTMDPAMLQARWSSRFRTW